MDERFLVVVDVRQHDPAALGGHRHRIGDQLALAEPHRHDHLVGHPAPRDLGDQLLGLLDRRRGVGGSEHLRHLALELDRVDGDDALGTGQRRTLHGVRADPADADHDDRLAGAHLGRVHGRAPTRHHSAAEEAGRLERDLGMDLDAARLVDHCALGERAEQAHDAEVLSTGVVTGRVVPDLAPRHNVRTEVAQVLMAAAARRAVAARRDEAEHDVVADGDPLDLWSHLDDDAGALVPADHRKLPVGVAGAEVLVGVAQSRRRQLDHDLTRPRRVELDLLDDPVGIALPQHRRTRPHLPEPPVLSASNEATRPTEADRSGKWSVGVADGDVAVVGGQGDRAGAGGVGADVVADTAVVGAGVDGVGIGRVGEHDGDAAVVGRSPPTAAVTSTITISTDPLSLSASTVAERTPVASMLPLSVVALSGPSAPRISIEPLSSSIVSAPRTSTTSTRPSSALMSRSMSAGTSI